MKTQALDFQWAQYFDQLAGPRPRALLLDYDGTLAPFRVERDQALVDPQLRDALEGICRTGRTRVVIISGRALRDLIPLLDLEPLPELWGCHGWERLLPDGQYQAPDLAPGVRTALEAAGRWTTSAGLDGRCERKPASLAVHWRGLDAVAIQQLRNRVSAAWAPLAGEAGMELHDFDGGLEMRAAGRTKGYAVAQILRELPTDAIVAYAGDDYTDEDAFRALVGRGLSIRVGSSYRVTAADVWLQAPDEWARFLNAWMAADTEGVRS
jgi:trehalose 6-phosphate phosphatase